MSDVLHVNAVEQLKPFLNKDNIVEIAVRAKDRKFKAFQKIALGELHDEKAREALENVANAMKKNNLLQANNLKKLEHLARLNNIGLVLNGLNLCATCAGFALVLNKLDEMSKEIDQSIKALEQDIKSIQDVNSGLKYRDVLLDHQNMLDRKRRNKPYDEEKMSELVNDEYNVLCMLLEMLEKNVSNNNEQLICSIFSMASMLTVSLMEFDEIYYFNNKESIEDGNCLHSLHDHWMSVYETLSSDWVVEKLQDIAVFDMNLDTLGADIYYEELQDQVEEMRQEVEDNDSLISTLDDPDLLQDLRDYNNQMFIESIKSSVDNESDDPDFIAVCDRAAEQVAQTY